MNLNPGLNPNCEEETGPDLTPRFVLAVGPNTGVAWDRAVELAHPVRDRRSSGANERVRTGPVADHRMVADDRMTDQASTKCRRCPLRQFHPRRASRSRPSRRGQLPFCHKLPTNQDRFSTPLDFCGRSAECRPGDLPWVPRLSVLNRALRRSSNTSSAAGKSTAEPKRTKQD